MYVCGDDHPVQLALAVFVLPATGTNTPLNCLVQLVLCGAHGGCVWWYVVVAVTVVAMMLFVPSSEYADTFIAQNDV